MEKSNTLTVIVPDYATLNTQPDVRMTVNPSYGTSNAVGTKNPAYDVPVSNCRRPIKEQNIYE